MCETSIMSSYFYGLVQQRGPWATTDVDILRSTQPRVTQSVVESRGATPANPAMAGVLAGNAGYGKGFGYATNNAASTINGITPTPSVITPPGWGVPSNVVPQPDRPPSGWGLPDVVKNPQQWGVPSGAQPYGPISPKQIGDTGIWGNQGRDPMNIGYDTGGWGLPDVVKNPQQWGLPSGAKPYTPISPKLIGNTGIWGNQGRDPLKTNTSNAPINVNKQA
jgi:hypothetical protein